MTNRVNCPPQLIDGKMSENDSIIHHIKVAAQLENMYGSSVKRVTGGISGLLMVIKKSVWKDVKFKETGILGVDTDFCRRLQKPIYIMKGLYVLHYYRLIQGFKDKTHLK